MIWHVNTSNSGKLAEYKKYLGEQIQSIQQDLAEPDADALTIIRYKASQFESVIVDDVSLVVEGEDVGTNIRWLLEDLPRFVGKSAQFICDVGIHRSSKVEIYRGVTEGKLVEPRGEGYGFNPYFLPDTASLTLAEKMEDDLNARKRALDHLLAKRVWKIEEPLFHWSGKFQ